MDLFPDLGAWLFRSVRRDTFAESPVLAVQRLKLLPQPIGDSDKDVLVGAVLNLGSNLSQALHILLELLPEDKAGERLGEILCPTLGQLLATLQTTLSAFECRTPTRQVSLRGGRLKHSRSESALRSAVGLPKVTSRPLTPILMKRTPPETPKTPRPREGVANTRAASSPLQFTSPPTKQPKSRHLRKDTEEFPKLRDDSLTTPHQQHEQNQPPTPPASRRTETSGLQNALKSELRVQAAIRVAVDSLEFAEGQLQLVKEINHLHGGSFDLMQRNFYTGYNNLLLRALELEQLQSGGPPSRPASFVQSGQGGIASRSGHQRQQASVHVSFPANMPTPPHNASSPLRAGGSKGNATTTTAGMATSDSEAEAGIRHGMTRRNTIQGIREESLYVGVRPTIKRRLSLAEELALAGEDSDSDDGDSDSDNGDESAVDSATGMAGERTDEASEEEASQQSESQGDSDDDDRLYDSEQHGDGGGESSTSSNGFTAEENDGRNDSMSKQPRFQGRRS
ncbi:hypothetical protein B0T21DRAFT_283877 [Apiosordaria backusii]|uniref:Uncharacterized protein n=1 Tax=Apiosordaria backusii TaxID=314023 RepID=A0AA40K1N8_9PEZI|nr:hypothetical protein B0T21DRAFT_283877 [Apiosordaria backusii]